MEGDPSVSRDSVGVALDLGPGHHDRFLAKSATRPKPSRHSARGAGMASARVALPFPPGWPCGSLSRPKKPPLPPRTSTRARSADHSW